MLISAGPAKDLRKKPSWTETLGASVAHPVRAMQAGCSRVRPSALCDAVLSPEPDATTTREAPMCALIHPWIIWSLWAV